MKKQTIKDETFTFDTYRCPKCDGLGTNEQCPVCKVEAKKEETKTIIFDKSLEIHP